MVFYRSRKNETFLEPGMFKSDLYQTHRLRRRLPEDIARANARRSNLRSAVEHVLARQKRRMGPVIRTIDIARARIKIGMTNLALKLPAPRLAQGAKARPFSAKTPC